LLDGDSETNRGLGNSAKKDRPEAVSLRGIAPCLGRVIASAVLVRASGLR